MKPEDDAGQHAPSPAPSAPDVARRVFPSGMLGAAQRYADLLATEGVVRGLIGPREAPRLWERHLLNCAVLGDLVPPDATLADIGSGAGLPGLVLAIARADLQITLVEPLLRRTTFLEEVVVELGLTGVEVVRGRAEALHGSRRFDVVTSRAVAPLGRLLDWSMPLVAPTGALVAMKGSSVRDEVEGARADLDRWGCAEPEVHVLGEGLLDPPTLAVRVAWGEPGRVSWPLASAPVPSPGRSRREKRTRGDRRRGA